MSCGATGDIKIEPVNVTWEIEEQWHVKTIADVSSSSNSNYFRIGKSGQTTHSHYVWLDVGNTGVDPAVAGLTGVEVNIAANDTAATIATAIAAAVTALSDFTATASGDTVTITCIGAGDSAGLLDGAGAAATGFTFTQCQEGGTLDLGLLQGDVESGFEETLLELTAHQTGVTPIADLRQGVKTELSLVMQEATVTKLKEIFAKSGGGTDTPSGGTEVFGWGTSRQGLNTIIQARRLVLHPVAKSDTDYSGDLCFWKAYPMPESLIFSGENPKTLSVSWKFYLDASKPAAISLFCFKDWTQYIPANP